MLKLIISYFHLIYDNDSFLVRDYYTITSNYCKHLTKKYEETQIDNENELNDTINMKYPYYKKKEPRNINGSGIKMKKQFRFNRK